MAGLTPEADGRAEHLAWAKGRALMLVAVSRPRRLGEAMASLISDLGKHDQTRGLVTRDLMAAGVAALTSSEPKKQLRAWINGVD